MFCVCKLEVDGVKERVKHALPKRNDHQVKKDQAAGITDCGCGTRIEWTATYLNIQ